jgi:hypothetical protein
MTTYAAPRTTSKEFKKLLRQRFPGVRWYVSRLPSPYCNFIDVGFGEGDLDIETYQEFRRLCDEYTDGLEPTEDFIPLGRQAIHIQGERILGTDGKFYFSNYRIDHRLLDAPSPA